MPRRLEIRLRVYAAINLYSVRILYWCVMNAMLTVYRVQYGNRETKSIHGTYRTHTHILPIKYVF